MSRLTFIARSDDLGSSGSANRAIDAVTKAGFIKNVSVMAPGIAVEDAAELLAGRKDICFGMHTTLNAEWDRIKWAPVLPLDEKSGLVEKNGCFLSDPAQFEKTRPAVETIMREVNAQLEKLHGLGFDIHYIDSHMFPEVYVPGLDEAMEAFAKRKGLIDHMYFYNLPPGFRRLPDNPSQTIDILKAVPQGQYFLLAHPALDTAETRKTGNSRYSGDEIAKARAAEAKFFSDASAMDLLKRTGCEGIRYDEAAPQERAAIQDIKAMFC